MQLHSELPSLRATVRLQGSWNLEHVSFYDVKFYPYTEPGEDAVFAVVGGRWTIVCRCVQNPDSSIEILKQFEDKDPEEYLNSICWAQAKNGDPLVCVSGTARQIKVLNVVTGELVTTLIGHGGDVNDIVASPLDPTILASCSVDRSVRLWSLDPAHGRSPSAAIYMGESHSSQVLTIAYHPRGKYILSGSMDTRVNLWTVPDDLNKHMGTDKPAMIRYPHFTTTDVHSNYVDCVRFHNDVILSRAAQEDAIQMWRIVNFNSDLPPPNEAPIPLIATTNSDSKVTVAPGSVSGTHSAWDRERGFQRLLQFDFPGTKIFYIRFGFFNGPGAHPILITGNEQSKIFMWDLQRLEDLDIDDEPVATKSGLSHLTREGSVTSVTSGRSAGPASTSSSVKGTIGKSYRPRHGIGDAFLRIKPHKEIMVPKYDFQFKQFDWSNNGQWCVGVGSYSVINILHRWEKGVPPPI